MGKALGKKVNWIRVAVQQVILLVLLYLGIFFVCGQGVPSLEQMGSGTNCRLSDPLGTKVELLVNLRESHTLALWFLE